MTNIYQYPQKFLVRWNKMKADLKIIDRVGGAGIFGVIKRELNVVWDLR